MEFLNSLTLYGKVISNEKEYEFVNKLGKTMVFYKIMLECIRKKDSEVVDMIPIILGYPLAKTIQVGDLLQVDGSVSSRKAQDDDGKNIIETFVFANHIFKVNEDEYEEYCTRNEHLINGIVTREPKVRQINNHNKIASFVVAIHRPHENSTKVVSDYIQCVAWDSLVNDVEDFKIGDEISLCGRFQSRTYTTKEEKTRTIQEVVINEASLWKEEEALNNG